MGKTGLIDEKHDRLAYAEELLDKDPTMPKETILSKVREKFGMGIGALPMGELIQRKRGKTKLQKGTVLAVTHDPSREPLERAMEIMRAHGVLSLKVTEASVVKYHAPKDLSVQETAKKLARMLNELA